MSLASELARAEAEEAEREDADAEEQAEAEESQEEQEQPEEQAAFAAIGPDEIKKAEKAIESQRDRLGKILGAESVAEECFVCAGMGFLPELPPAGTHFELIATEAGLTFEATEPPEAQGYLHAPDKDTCPECDGLGQTITGSKVPHARVFQCAKCMGNGYVTVPRDGTPSPDGYQAPAPPGPNAIAPTPEQAIDSWGRPWGHQHWGVPPANIQG